jgi:hypothetical protein
MWSTLKTPKQTRATINNQSKSSLMCRSGELERESSRERSPAARNPVRVSPERLLLEIPDYGRELQGFPV